MHFFPFAVHIFRCSIVEFSIISVSQAVFSLIAYTGSLFIAISNSPYYVLRRVPSSKAIVTSYASCDVASVSVYSLFCNAKFFIIEKKRSCTRLPVCSPNSHLDANQFSESQNSSKDPACICFRDRNQNRPRVLLRFVSTVFFTVFEFIF